MKKTTKRLVVGTLLCSMACMEVPAWTYGTDTVACVQAAETNRIIRGEQITVSLPYFFPMGQHLAEGISFEDCIFESSDTSIAIVNEEGTVIPLCDGIVDITVTTKDGRKDTRAVKIEDNENVAFTLDEGIGTHHGKQAIINGSIPSGYACVKNRNKAVLRIASTIHGEYQVRKIAPNAFQGNKELETVILPESMAYVEEKAFADCENLKTIFVTGMDTMFEEDTFEGDEIVLKGFEGSEAEAYAEEHDNITFEEIDIENDDYYPYEEAIYFTRNFRMVEDKLSMSTEEETVLYPAVASYRYSNADIEYRSSNNKVATIKDGIITGKNAGTVTITASLPNGVEKSIEVTVEGEEIEDIPEEEQGFDDFIGDETIAPDKVVQQSVQKNNINTSKTNIKLTSKKTSIKVGKTYQFKANVSNITKDTDKKLKWSVSNKKLASINKTTGKFKAKKTGKVVVKVSYGNVEKAVKVKIKK